MKRTRKQYIAWARVSSREQEQEGFSLDVQVNGFLEYGKREDAVIDPIYKVAETASKAIERREFKDMIAFAKKNAKDFDGILFYKIDRAARNLRDFVELEELESKYSLPFIAITQPVQNTPTGKMVRRTLATMAAFQTDQQSLDVREGIARRVAEGWFPSNPPFGYRTLRREKRSTVETHRENGPKVTRIFDLRATQQMTGREIAEQLFADGTFYSDSKPKFSESKVHSILHDKSYLGFISFRGSWYPGRHEPLVDQVTWDQVRVSFNEQNYRSHELVYGSRLIRCGHCGNAVTGEEKFKETKGGLKTYIYYRCTRYRSAGHPRIRITEQELDRQLQERLKPLAELTMEARKLIRVLARSILEHRFNDESVQVAESKRLLSLLETQRSKLLRRNLSGSIADALYDRQSKEFDDQEVLLKQQLARHLLLQQKIDSRSDEAENFFDDIANEFQRMERRARQLALSALFGGFRLDGRGLIPENETPLELFRRC